MISESDCQGGDAKLVLDVRTEEASLDEAYAQLSLADTSADGALDSTWQETEDELNGSTLDDELFENTDELALFGA